LGESLPQFAVKSNAQYWETIEKQFKAIAADVQNLNAYRYPQLTWGNQEFMEAVSFQHYLETQTLISYEDSKSRVASLCGDGPVVPLTPEDYVLGIFDMVGELMRFSITGIANNGKLPAGKPNASTTRQDESVEETADQMDVDEEPSSSAQVQEPRNVLEDLREIRLQLEMFEPPRGDRFYGEVEKKMVVMRECVDKVEKALYQLTVRGKERPKGWRPDAGGERRPEVESY
jgi:predicted translin family RNA/ssDNA-binding protein